MARITLQDNGMSAVMKMADGNPGAVSALMEMMLRGVEIDPYGIGGGVGLILLLDTFEIYGTDVYVLYSDICEKDLTKMATVIRACQLGFISQEIVKDAASRQDYSGRELIDIDDLYSKVKAQLPRFNSVDERVSR